MAYCRVCHKQKPEWHFEDYPEHRADGPKRTLADMHAAPDIPANYKPRGSAGGDMDMGTRSRPAPRAPRSTSRGGSRPRGAPRSTGSDSLGMWGRIAGGAALLAAIGAPILGAWRAAQRGELH